MNDVKYPELPDPDATTVGLGAVWNRHSMRSYADATCALRGAQKESHAAPGAPQQEASSFAVRLGEESIASRAAATAPAGGVTEALREAAQWLHAAYDRPPVTPDCAAMLKRVDAALNTAARAAEPAFYINKSIIDPATGKMAAHVKTAITWSDKPINAAWSTPVYLGAARAAEPDMRKLLIDARHRIANLSRAAVPFDDPLDGPMLRSLDAAIAALIVRRHTEAASPTPPTGTSQGEGTS